MTTSSGGRRGTSFPVFSEGFQPSPATVDDGFLAFMGLVDCSGASRIRDRTRRQQAVGGANMNGRIGGRALVMGADADLPSFAAALAAQSETQPFVVLLAGRNFGRNLPSAEVISRLQAAGIRVIVAESFSPEFVSDSHDWGDFLALQSEYHLCDGFETGDCVEVDLQRCHLRDAHGSAAYPLRPLSRVA
jgi:hypothetical protein